MIIGLAMIAIGAILAELLNAVIGFALSDQGKAG